MKTLSVGIGCRRHSSAAHIEAAVRTALGPYALTQIRTVASIDIKADEAGLLEFCARHGLPLQLFSREQIAATLIANGSAAVQEHLGVDGVCEPCALLAAMNAMTAMNASAKLDQPAPNAALHARLVVPKTVHAGVTVAIASTDTDTGAAPTLNAPHEQDLR
ncbi:Cobalamin biosynthesis protein CbiG [Paraburkholderia ribeironis]|uniref:Cobalamin biosynthesis protein CbiG n=1 Tax=Paraburkholderia ribeironis TaxID=1247936 RepID=A0A1N7RX93_9BURK|nr:cobalamin biosynthesis protein [Paraburkholderia ribeironis]SIT39750.1 Cobalamin biosynthesis protein CbiG [Paraburkholderia ribeironis]